MRGGSGLARLFRFRRLPAIVVAGLLVVTVAPSALAAASAGGGASTRVASSRVTHLTPELARLHAEARADVPRGVTTHGPAPRIRPAGSAAPAAAPTLTVTNPFAEGGDEQLFVSWTPPSGSNGMTAQVVAYDVTAPTVAAGTCSIIGSTCTVTGLVNSHQYTAAISLCNGTQGCGPAVSTSVTTVARWPDPVSNLVVTGGDNSITASWSPPANNGGLAVSRYLVVMFNAARGYDWCYTLPTASADVTNTSVTFDPANSGTYYGAPVNGTAYRLVVFAVNNTIDGYFTGNDDCSPSAGVSQEVDSAAAYAGPVTDGEPAEAGQYTPLAPVPLAGASGTTVAAGGILTEAIDGRGAIPASGVAAVTLGVSITGAAAGGSVYAWNVNASEPADPAFLTNAGGTAATVTVPVGSSGTVELSSSVAGTVHVDALGYFSDGSQADAGSRYVSVAPGTLYNAAVTSSIPQPLSLNANYGVVGGVRPDAAALEVAIKVSGATTSGAVTLESTAATAPDAPAVYYAPGQVTSAVTQVLLDPNGQFLVTVSAGSATVQVQAIGYYTGPFDPSGGDFSLSQQTPLGGSPVIAGSTAVFAWPSGAPAASTVATEWLLVDAHDVTAAGTLSVYEGNNSAAVPVSVSPGADETVVIPVQLTSSGGTVAIASGTAVGSVSVDVVGYTLLGTTPAQPGGVYAAPIAGGAYLTWFAPCTDGGSPVSQYEIVASPGGSTLTVDGTRTSAFFYGLADGTSYSFEVLALNAAGAGPASPWTDSVTPEPTVPDPPDQAAAQAGDSSALVSWDTPARTGDSPVTGYVITANGIASQAVSGAATHQVVITGLTNGTAYLFQVEAVNAIGTSDPSVASISVTPTAGAPIAPALARQTPAKAPAIARAVTTCQPLASLSRPQAATSPDVATSTQYQIDGHLVTVTTPPASLNLATASLATLHKYDYALQVTTTAGLRAWQRRIGHPHAVPVVPCVMTGVAPSGAPAHFDAASCAASIEGATSATPGGSSPNASVDSYNWSGIVATAHGLPKEVPGDVMDTGDPFQTVEGEWQQTTNSADPGGTNILSSWVGLGGIGVDSHDPMGKAELVQAGTDMQTNNTPRAWWEVISWYNGIPAMGMQGFTGNRTDVFDTSVDVYDADKDYPLNPISQRDFQAGFFSAINPNSNVVFNWFDFTNGQSATLEVNGIYTDYNGDTAEWIDEPPIGGSQLAALPQFAPIKWTYAWANASYSNPYIDSGTPYLWNWQRWSLQPKGFTTCVAGPTSTNITRQAASWNLTWHSNTC